MNILTLLPAAVPGDLKHIFDDIEYHTSVANDDFMPR